MLTLPAEELGALVGVITQRTKHRACGGEEAVLPGGSGQLTQTRPEDEAALEVAGHETVVLEGDGQSVRRRAGEAGGRDELCERRRTGLEGAEDDGCLVQDADPGCVVHVVILASHCLRLTFLDTAAVRISETRWRRSASRPRSASCDRRSAVSRGGGWAWPEPWPR